MQLGYGWAVMTDDGFAKLGIRSEADLPAGGTLERDGERADGRDQRRRRRAIIALFDRLPKPTFAEQVEGTREFFRELNRLGLTGVVDPGGNNLFPADYQALFDVWRRGELTVRVAYSLNGQTAGGEFDELKSLTALAADGLRRRPAALQRPRRAHHGRDEQQPRADGRAQGALLRDRAVGGRARHDDHDALGPRRARSSTCSTIFERVNREVPIAPLRWSIAHLNDASDATLQRMNALGVGWTVQDAMYFGGEDLVRRQGADAARRIPPVVTGDRLGVHDRRRHRRASRRVVQPVHGAAVVPRRQDGGRHADPRARGNARSAARR